MLFPFEEYRFASKLLKRQQQIAGLSRSTCFCTASCAVRARR